MPLSKVPSVIPPGTTIAPWDPPDVTLDDKIKRELVAVCAINPQSTASTTYPPPLDGNPDFRDISYLRFNYPWHAPFSPMRRGPGGGAAFITEGWGLGLPWGNAFDAGDLTPGGGWFTSETPGPPSHIWTKAQGWGRWGPGAVILHPQGVEGYFNDIIRPVMDSALLYALDPTATTGVPVYNDIIAKGHSTWEPDAGQLALMKKQGGWIMFNMESFFPYCHDQMLTPDTGNGGVQYYPLGAYYVGYREARKVLSGYGILGYGVSVAAAYAAGSYPSNADLKIGWRRDILGTLLDLILAHADKRSPRTKKMSYEWPSATPAGVLVPDNPSNIHQRLLDEESDGTLDFLWEKFDATGMGIGYMPYLVVPDGDPTPPNTVTYSNYYYIRSGCMLRSINLKQRLQRCKLGITLRVTRNGAGMTDLMNRINAQVINDCDPDVLFLWESPGFDMANTPVPGASLEQQLEALAGIVGTAWPYLDAIARTDPTYKA